jgi:SAM-dependent methyltransferase
MAAAPSEYLKGAAETMKQLETFGLANLLRLNLRVLKLAVTRKWLRKNHYARGYDEAAKDYDGNWLVHLQSVTDGLIAVIPEIPEGPVIDLGCGSGYATEALARCFPHRVLNAVDISKGMLSVAQKNHGRYRANWIHADMLDYLACQPMAETAFIFSAWAIGYSHPGKVIRQAARLLKKGGVFAFVVNLSDTLSSVFRTFRRCMLHHPGLVQLAAAPGFPKSGSGLRNVLEKKQEDRRCVPRRVDGYHFRFGGSWHQYNRIYRRRTIFPQRSCRAGSVCRLATGNDHCVQLRSVCYTAKT